MSNDDHNNLPIGVFDSGVGGLTVLKAIQEELGEKDSGEREMDDMRERLAKKAEELSSAD